MFIPKFSEWNIKLDLAVCDSFYSVDEVFECRF
jgi:hypothetical protein